MIRVRQTVLAIGLSLCMVSASIMPGLAPTPKAQALGPAAALLALGAACSTPHGAAICAFAASSAVWWVHSNGPATADALESVITSAGLWWDANVGHPVRTAIEAQFASHPTYVQPDYTMLSTVWGEFAWNTGQWELATYSGMPMIRWGEAVNAPVGTEFWRFDSEPLAWPVHRSGQGCGAASIGSSVPAIKVNYARPAGFSTVAELRGYAVSDPSTLLVLSTWSVTGSTDTMLTQTVSSGSWVTASTGAGRCALIGEPWTWELTLKAQSATVPAGFALGGITLENDLTTGYTYMSFGIVDAAFVDFQIPTASEGVVNLPADVDDLIGWNGASALPLANGTTATVVTPVEVVVTGGTPGLTEDDMTWWSGLFTGAFGPMTGLLDDIKSNLGTVITVLNGTFAGIQSTVNKLTDVVTAVTALPALVAAEIQAVLSPATAWTDFWGTGVPALQADVMAAAPFCYAGAFVDGDGLFSSSGDGSWSVSSSLIGTVTVPALAGVAGLSYPLSTAVVTLLVLVWAANRLRRLSGE